MHAAAEAVADRVGDAPLIAVHVDERRQDQGCCEQEQGGEEDPVFCLRSVRVVAHSIHVD